MLARADIRQASRRVPAANWKSTAIPAAMRAGTANGKPVRKWEVLPPAVRDTSPELLAQAAGPVSIHGKRLTGNVTTVSNVNVRQGIRPV